MNYNFKLFLFIITEFYNTMGLNSPLSPCPNIFQYRFDGSEWFGLITLKNSAMNKILHLKVMLSVRGKPLSQTYLGEIELLTRGQTSYNASVMYKIKFPSSSILPRITRISINEHTVCFGPPDYGNLVTVIQLEHTRKLTFLTSDTTTGIQPSESINQSSSIYFDHADLRSLEQICGQVDFPAPTKFTGNSGELLSRGAWPWLAAIYVKGSGSISYHCAGTLVSPRIVLSSAHSFVKGTKRLLGADIVVILGRHNLLNWLEEQSVTVECDEIFIHPEFDENLKSCDADIAAIVLQINLRFNQFIRPACLWSGSTNLEYIEGEHGVVVSWAILQSRTTSSLPRKGIATIVSQSTCMNSNVLYRNLISNRTLCAGERDGIGPCSTASGVGLLMLRKNKWTLRGIFSTSPEQSLDENFCKLHDFTIYTDVAKFLDWIFALLI